MMDSEMMQTIMMIIMQSEMIVNKMADPLDMLVELQEEHPELKNSKLFQEIMAKREEALDFIDKATQMMDKINAETFGDELDIDELEDSDDDIFIN